MERRKQIAVEGKEIERKEKELTATVKRPAEAESYKVQTLAQGQRYVRESEMISWDWTCGVEFPPAVTLD